MKFIFMVVACAAMFAVDAAETLLDIDFTKDLRNVDSSRTGLCRGVLPKCVSDNFSSWSEGRATMALQEDDGVKYLHITSDAGKGAVQFSIYSPKIKVPGYFRLTVKGRVRGGTLGLGLRLNPAPYTSFSSHRFSSPDWDERTYIFQVNTKAAAGVGLYLYLGNGETDLRRVLLEKVERADLARTVKRPPPEKRVFVSRRFLLGLPNGWNDDRNTETPPLKTLGGSFSE